MLEHFNKRWNEVPTVWIDTETTGVRPGADRAVQVGLARFEPDSNGYGQFVSAVTELVNPGRPIPAEASAIHGITGRDVEGAPSISWLFEQDQVRWMLEHAQPGAYNAPFDRHFVPPFGEDWTWPWLDSLCMIRLVDRYAKGKGRHKLEVSCKRHGIELTKAHDAGADARAAGELFYRLMAKASYAGSPLASMKTATLGELLRFTERQAAEEWYRWNEFKARSVNIDQEKLPGVQ